MSEGLCSIFFTSRSSREEEQKMRRIFVTDIFRARAQKRSCLMALTQLCLLAAILFFLPKKNLNFTYHHHQSLHTFSEGLTTHIVKGQRATTSPRPHTGPWSLSLASKTCQKKLFSHITCVALLYYYQIEIITLTTRLILIFVVEWKSCFNLK